MIYQVILFILFSTLPTHKCTSLSVGGYCGTLGQPVRSRVSPVQWTSDNDNQTVVYSCKDYISFRQYRQCVKGKWIGKPAVCGKAFTDNDLKVVKIYDSLNNTLISEYNLTDSLKPFAKFGNSFIAQRYEQPIRAFGSTAYRWELYLQSEAIIQFVRFSLTVVNHLLDDQIRRIDWNITAVSVSRYRHCSLHSQSSVSPWAHNSTRYNFWYLCESTGDQAFADELNDKSNLVAVEMVATAEIVLDLDTLILAEGYTRGDNPRQPVCGTPDVPPGLTNRAINTSMRYAFKCVDGFVPTDPTSANDWSSHVLYCNTDMKWRGTLPKCMPKKWCKKYESDDKELWEVYRYRKAYYYNASADWLAVGGTAAYIRCKDDRQVLEGNSARVCGKSGGWSGSYVNCIDAEKKYPEK